MSTRKLLNLGCGDKYHADWVNVDFHSSDPAVLAHDLKEKLPFEADSYDVVYHSHVLEHLPKRYVQMFIHECYRVLKPGGIIRLVVPDLEQIARIYLDLLERALKADNVARERYNWIMIEMLDQIARNQSGGEMLKYWMQDPMPAEDFVIERVGSEAAKIIHQLRNSQRDDGSVEKPFYYEDDYETIGKFRLSGEVHQWMYDRYSSEVLLKSAGFYEIRKCKADESAMPGFTDYFLDIEQNGSIRKPDSLYLEAKKPLQESNSERTTRLDAIKGLDVQLKQSVMGRGTKKSLVAQLEAQLRESEADRAARLEVIQSLDAQLKTNNLYISQIEGKLEEIEEKLEEIRSSLVWKLIAPLRWIRRNLFKRK